MAHKVTSKTNRVGGPQPAARKGSGMPSAPKSPHAARVGDGQAPLRKGMLVEAGKKGKLG